MTQKQPFPKDWNQSANVENEIEVKLDEADHAATASDVRCTAEEVFSRIANRIHNK